jgi:hypothetical protein
MDPKPTAKIEDAIEISADALAEMLARIDSSGLSDSDKKLIKSLVTTVTTLKTLLERRTGRLMAILRKIFGLKTETRAKSGRRPGDDDKKDKPPGDKKRKGGKGRNGREDYPGAKKIRIEHECLKTGDTCPECQESTLKETRDGIAYRWMGQTPLVLNLYALQRFLCEACKATFSAIVPGEQRDRTDLDPSTSELRGAVKERSVDASCAAAIATLRFEMGVPNYRLAEIQAQQGVPLAPSSQYTIMDEAFRAPAKALIGELEKRAGADSNLFINDDTRARIMEIERNQKNTPETESAKPATETKTTRKKVQTSAIVARSGDQTIALYYTGHRNAGENLAQILAHRASDASVPLQMCDGLSANHPAGFATLLGNCLDHARRKFKDVEAAFPDDVSFVLDTLGKVYANDAKAKQDGMRPAQRLAWHQEQSAPIMAALEHWATSGLDQKLIEPNSTLGGAVKYMQKRWPTLTAFLRVEGMPLASTEVERLIKKCIRHRKNSLHYKTIRGAELGDMLMSLIQTCRYAGQGSHEYLTAIARSAAEVIKNPAQWMPWNFKLAVESINSA